MVHAVTMKRPFSTRVRRYMEKIMARGAMCPPWEVWEAQGNEISYQRLVLLYRGPVRDQKESAAQTRVKEQSCGGINL